MAQDDPVQPQILENIRTTRKDYFNSSFEQIEGQQMIHPRRTEVLSQVQFIDIVQPN